MKQPKFVILRGKPTAGKSTAYNNLKKNKNMKDWLFVDHCALKNELGKELGKKSLFAVLRTVMPSQKNIIIQEMSKDTLKKLIPSYIKKYNYKIVVFQFTINPQTAYKRDVQRSKQKMHPYMGKKRIDELNIMHDNKFDENSILIDTNKLGKRDVVNFILKKLRLK